MNQGSGMVSAILVFALAAVSGVCFSGAARGEEEAKVQAVIDAVEEECLKGPGYVYTIGRIKARRLAELVRGAKPRLVVECGTAIGYSGLWIARELRAAGQGRLELVDMKVQPRGFLTDLLALGGVVSDREMLAVRVQGADFVVQKGRVAYRDFALVFPNEFDLRFSGSVGLDDSVNLSVSVPVGEGLFRRLGIRGPVAEYAKVLVGTRVEIPVAGTRQKPRLDLSRVDVKALVNEALKRSGGKRIGDALKGLLEVPKKQ